MSLSSFDGTGNDPVLGTIHWRNDATHAPSDSWSTLTGAQGGSQFPARGVISIYIEAEIDGVEGIYRSNDPVVLENNNVTSFNPFVNELFVWPTQPDGTPAPPIIFTNSVTGDQITLTDLTSLLN